MAWIEPLTLKTWIINVFAGGGDYFAVISIFVLLSLAGMFRMGGLTIGFLIFIFISMFSGYIPPSITIFVSIIAGLIVGYTIPKIISR